MSLPALILLITFLLVPFIMSVGYSFTNQRLMSNPNLAVKFMGFENYLRIFRSDTFFSAIRNNLTFTLVVVPVQVSLALFLAILLNQKLRGVVVFRTVCFSPIVITMIVVSIVWALLFNPNNGMINEMLRFLSFGTFQGLGWLYDTKTALAAIMILSVWQGVGFQMIILLAGLQGIPGELYEAAGIDGADAVRKFKNITIPSLKNTLLFCFLSTTILAFKLFTQVWVLTQGGPEDATLTTVALIYKEGFAQQKVGYSAAISVVFFLIVLLLSLLQRRVLTKEDRT
jgi:multiple sugar transport system permease protein